MKFSPSFDFEKVYWKQGLTVAGVDEVGKGSFAGPVVAAAVVFPSNFTSNELLFRKINDSKLISPKLRLELSKFIKSVTSFAVAEVSVKEIDKVGIGNATRAAILQAVLKLSKKPQALLVDGYSLKNMPLPQKGIIKGDRLSLSIAAASIIAKVHRDTLMEKLHQKYGNYGFDVNKGYGTAKHREMLRMHGLCPLHRLSFDLSKYTKPLEFIRANTTQ